MDSMRGKNFPKRGEIYWIDLDPTIGNETKKTRPGLIVSNNDGNELSGIVMVAPISSKVKNIFPFEVEVNLKGKRGKIMLNQCRALDKSRLVNKLGEVDEKLMQAVEDAIRIVFALK